MLPRTLTPALALPSALALALVFGACGGPGGPRATSPGARATDTREADADAGAPPPADAGLDAGPDPTTVRAADHAPRWVLPDAATRASKTAELARRLERVLDEEHDRGRTGASFSFALVVDGRVALTKARGVADLENKVVATPDTIYRIASITKTFTATALLALRDEGKLRLDDPLALHLPELREAQYPTSDAAPITIADVLSHGAGLARSGAYAALERPSTEADLAEAMRGALDLDPGVSYRYSNLGFGLLGLAIARKERASYRDVIRARLLAPLGMTSSGFDAAALPAERLAVGYVRDARGALIRRPMTQNGAGEGAGGLFSTARDMAAWLSLQLGAWPPRSGDDTGPLRRATLREAHAPRRVHDVTTRDGFVDGVYARRLEARSVGLAWHVTQGCYFERLVGHDGDLDGFHARLRFDPSRGVGFVLLTSSDSAEATPIAERLLDVIALFDGLGAYTRAPAEALTGLVERALARMSAGWTDEDQEALLTESLRVQLAAREVRRLADERRAEVGTCRLSRAAGATSALDGSFVFACDRGGLAVHARATGAPLRLQSLTVHTVTPPTPEDTTAARAVVAAMRGGGAGDLAAALGARDVTSTAARLRTRGASAGPCRLGPGERTGKTTSFELTCSRERGTLELVRSPSGARPEVHLAPRCVR